MTTDYFDPDREYISAAEYQANADAAAERTAAEREHAAIVARVADMGVSELGDWVDLGDALLAMPEPLRAAFMAAYRAQVVPVVVGIEQVAA